MSILKKLCTFILLMAASVVSNADQTKVNEQYTYKFPEGDTTPFDDWNTHIAVTKPEDKEAAEFAAMFTAKMITIVSNIKETKDGKQAYVIVANQRCILDMVRHEDKYVASAIKCSTKPFGQF